MSMATNTASLLYLGQGSWRTYLPSPHVLEKHATNDKREMALPAGVHVMNFGFA